MSSLTFRLCGAQVWASPAGPAAEEGGLGAGGSPGTGPPPRRFPRNSVSKQELAGLVCLTAARLLYGE